MPGAPKSCAICRARKVKCDRAQPACLQCIKYCWTCPGYPPSRISLNERPPAKDRPSLESRREQERIPSQGLGTMLRHLPDSAVPRLNIFLPPDFLCSSVARELVGHLASTQPQGQSLSQIGAFIHFVPVRLGINDALDAAVKCLCFAFSIFLSSKTSVDQTCYLKSLKSLRQCLLTDEGALSAEVLCATVCLSWYEVLLNNLDSSWLAHAAGCAKLIQLRGPQRHVEGFGRAVLHAEHGLITCEAFVEQQPSFLDSSGWEDVIDAPLPVGETDLATKLMIKHFKLIAKLSALQGDLVSTGRSTTSKALSIHQQLLGLRETCKRDLCLASNPDSPDRNLSNPSYNCDNFAIIFCKCAMGHIFIDVSLLELYGKFPVFSQPQTSEVPTSVNSDASHASWNGQKLSEDYLNLEIEGLFELAQSSFHRAAKSSPLGWRRLVSTYRVICAQACKTRDHHPIWDQIHQLVL